MSETFHVYGPPGCGKTTYLSGQISKAAESRGNEAVLVASLTRAAATEMASRGTGLPEKNVGTLHAHCFRQLGSPEIAESKIDIWNEENKGSNFRLKNDANLSLDEKKLEGKTYNQGKGDDNFAQMNVYRSQMVPEKEWIDPVLKFYERWKLWKEDHNFMDFTELIEKGITDTWSAPNAPQVLIGDETQDWSKLEMSLFRDHWGSRAEIVMMAGDPDQTIYSWRGADSGCFMDHEIPEGNKRYLKQSYRIPIEPHKYARKLIQRIHNREDFEFSPVDKPGSVERLNATSKNCNRIISLVEEEIKAGRTVMILGTCGYVLYPIIKRLKKEGIPFHNPFRLTNASWNPLARSKKKVMPVDRLISFIKPDEEEWGQSATEWDAGDFTKWMSILKQEKLLSRGSKKLVAGKKFEAPETWEDFAKLFVSEEEAKRAISMDLDWWEKNLMGSQQKKFQYPLHVLRNKGGKALKESPKVVVGTIHSVKGGEADTVVVLPDLSPQANDLLHKKEAKDSLNRLFYVAVTRTKNKLYLCNAEGLRFQW
jgi:DNA helicase II / ATP-dependent DNA helicase PcrA